MGTCLFMAKCMTSVPVMFMFTDAFAFPSVVGLSKYGSLGSVSF